MERKKKEVAIEEKIKRKEHTLIVLSSTLKWLVYYSLFQSRPSVKVFLFYWITSLTLYKEQFYNYEFNAFKYYRPCYSLIIDISLLN